MMSSWQVPALPHFRSHRRLVVQPCMHVQGSVTGSGRPAPPPAVLRQQLVFGWQWPLGDRHAVGSMLRQLPMDPLGPQQQNLVSSLSNP